MLSSIVISIIRILMDIIFRNHVTHATALLGGFEKGLILLLSLDEGLLERVGI